MTVARLALGIGMMPYGVSKLFDLQFQVGAWNYARPLGELPGTLLTWAFLGYSPAFQFLLGLFEVGPAILLLSARTRRVGALLLFPVVLNVAMINYFLDLWPATRIISTVMLALNTFLILYDYDLYLSFLSQLLAPSAPIANRKLRIAAKAAGFMVPAVLIGLILFDFHSKVESVFAIGTDFVGRRQINRAGTWKIASLSISGQVVPGAAADSLYFDLGGRCVRSDGVHHDIGKFQADQTHGTFQIQDIPFGSDSSPIQGSYRVDRDRLLLDGHRGSQTVSLVLQRARWAPPGR
ncbi:MAG TPA: hypothetical protein VKU19_21685 [Bryobacteraceae bacterium]|nr:hypothetical protein [Bryobacteraceae bacterium]